MLLYRVLLWFQECFARAEKKIRNNNSETNGKAYVLRTAQQNESENIRSN